MSDGGKGSTPRPIEDYDSFSKNWDSIFNRENDMVRVSGVPYEVDLINQYTELLDEKIKRGDLIAELERENFMLRARTERLEEEVQSLHNQVSQLMREVANQRPENK